MSVQAVQIAPEAKDRWPVFYLFCFIVCYISAGIVTQIYSGIHPTLDSSPLDYFTGGALWILSAICMMNGMARSENFLRMAFWLGGSVVLALLAIDEYIGMHETTQFVVGDDDHIKVLLWAISPFALWAICRALDAPKSIALIFALGWSLHSVYLATDLGDGDYFSLPFALSTLQWTEDICELMFVSTYLFAFMLMTSDTVRQGRD